MKPISIAALGALALAALASTPSYGLVPAQVSTQLPTGLSPGMTAAQLAQLLSQNPQLAAQLRERIRQSGLTPEQVHAQLAASGYPPNLLDAYLGAVQPGQPTWPPSPQELAAIQALGLAAIGPAAEPLQVDTGFIRARSEALRAESLAIGNYVFGIDIFRRTTT